MKKHERSRRAPTIFINTLLLVFFFLRRFSSFSSKAFPFHWKSVLCIYAGYVMMVCTHNNNCNLMSCCSIFFFNSSVCRYYVLIQKDRSNIQNDFDLYIILYKTYKKKLVAVIYIFKVCFIYYTYVYVYYPICVCIVLSVLLVHWVACQMVQLSGKAGKPGTNNTKYKH